MPNTPKNPYLIELFNRLNQVQETESDDYTEVVTLDPNKVTEDDYQSIYNFINEPHKRAFLCQIAGKDRLNQLFALCAKRAFLQHNAQKQLQNTNTEPQISPFKLALHQNDKPIRVNIQIQKNYQLPKPKINNQSQGKMVQQNIEESIDAKVLENVTEALNNETFTVLIAQLKALTITKIQPAAKELILQYPAAFKDGIIPHQLPKGFYLDKTHAALCFTAKPKRLPHALTPTLVELIPTKLPTIEDLYGIFPKIKEAILTDLLGDDVLKSKIALCSLLPTYAKEVRATLDSLSPKDAPFLIPILSKVFILGDEAQVALITRLIKACQNKSINLQFLNTPFALDALLSPRGSKNLHKLASLPAEQRAWWDTLVAMHLQYDPEGFDFNTFFEAYTQTFLAKIDDKHLTLPLSCPIKHQGHMLVTLNRVMDVLDSAVNPQEQCFSLDNLDWAALGVHFAMTKSENPVLQAAANMQIHHPLDLATSLSAIHNTLNQEDCALKPWVYRYLGQHWLKNINLKTIEEQLKTIENTAQFTNTQKNKLTFILAQTFANKEIEDSESWVKTLKDIINSLANLLEDGERNIILDAFTEAFLFKPAPSLDKVNKLIYFTLQLKQAFPPASLQDDIVAPLVSCLKIEGFDLLNNLNERLSKTVSLDSLEKETYKVTHALTKALFNKREQLQALLQDSYPNFIKILTSLNEDSYQLDEIIKSLITVKTTKGPEYMHALIYTLSQINVQKSEHLPDIAQINNLITALTNINYTIPHEYNSLEQKKHYFKSIIGEINFLPGTIIGQGDISKLDGIIVEALADSIKKRKKLLDIPKFRKEFAALLDATLPLTNKRAVPIDLKNQVTNNMEPVYTAFKELFEILQSPNPKFDAVINALKVFEESKKKLLKEDYPLPYLGTSKGAYILRLIFTGKKHPDDKMTSWRLTLALTSFHTVVCNAIRKFFAKPETQNTIKDLDADTALKYLRLLSETTSPIFFFKEELVDKKVLPAMRKTLIQLNLNDKEFEEMILKDSAYLEENDASDVALLNYKNKIEDITAYLNLLIDLKDKEPINFNSIYKKLNTYELKRFNYQQKLKFIEILLNKAKGEFEHLTNLTIEALANTPNADEAAIERAIDGIQELFNFVSLGEMRDSFYKMSLSHNLRSTTAFPLKELNALQKSGLAEEVYAPLTKEIIQLLGRLTDPNSAEMIPDLIKKTQDLLIKDPHDLELCLNLLKRLNDKTFSQDVREYKVILENLDRLNPENRKYLATILTGFAFNTKDETVTLPRLRDITQGLERRQEYLKQVADLFAAPPYPEAETLNNTLGGHGSEKLKAYCAKFDLDPFATTGKSRQLDLQFSDDYVLHAITKIEDLMHADPRCDALKRILTQELMYINNIAYVDPLNPPRKKEDFYTKEGNPKLQKLTSMSRAELRKTANKMLTDLRENNIPEDKRHLTKLKLLAYLREIYFRTTGKFLNSTQMLTILLAQHVPPNDDLLMRIKTGEGKSLITPLTSVFQWTQGGSVNIYTANDILALRDYENSYKPFFDFFCEDSQDSKKMLIPSTLLTTDSKPNDYKLNGINCATIDDFNGLLLEAEESGKTHYILNGTAIHANIDECDDAFFDKIDLTKLVGQNGANESSTIWMDELAYEFTRLKNYRNIDPNAKEKPWDNEEDIDKFRAFLSNKIDELYAGDIEKQNYLLAATRPQLRQLIQASCQAEKIVENKQFVMRPIKSTDEAGNAITKLLVSVPLHKSIPRPGAIFTDGLQQALYIRLAKERPDLAHLFVIDPNPLVLASRSAHSLIGFHHTTGGQIIGISGTIAENDELRTLSSVLNNIQAFGFDPHYGDKREEREPIFTYSDEETQKAIQKVIKEVQKPIEPKYMPIDDDLLETNDGCQEYILQTKKKSSEADLSQTRPILILNEDFAEATKVSDKLAEVLEQERGKNAKKDYYKLQVVDGRETASELERKINKAGKPKWITSGTAMLGRGIDINTGDHPEGLFVIQTFSTSKRMTDQFKGRAARNGKPGRWQAIYQIARPTSWLERILHFLFPAYRQRYNQRKIAEIQKIRKEEDTVNRLYNQAIDNIQNVLIQHIRAFDELLFECFPTDPSLDAERYRWRESLFKEISKFQDPALLTKEKLQEGIDKFQLNVCRIWETLKEEKWASKISSAPNLTHTQKLKLKYLRSLSLAEDIKTQTRLHETSQPITEGMQQTQAATVAEIILDKAGAELKFGEYTNEVEANLKLARFKQLLPNFIMQFCTAYPEAIVKLKPKDSKSRINIPLIGNLGSLVDKINLNTNKLLRNDERINKLIKQISDYYEDMLTKNSKDTISLLCKTIKPLVMQYAGNLENLSIKEQLKAKQLLLNFAEFYKAANEPKDEALDSLRNSYDETIMRRLANYLINEFDWVTNNKANISYLLTRKIAIEAATQINAQALRVYSNPKNSAAVQELYRLLQSHSAILKDKLVLSLGHSAPDKVINTALSAIDTLDLSSFCCSHEFKTKCHDNALINKHMVQFKLTLNKDIPYYESKEQEVLWINLHKILEDICNTSANAALIELPLAIKRFQKACPNYFSKHLNNLLTLINTANQELAAGRSLIEDSQSSLLNAKAASFAAIFKVPENKIHIQTKYDGLNEYIELQMEESVNQSGFMQCVQSKSNDALSKEAEIIKTRQSEFAKIAEELKNKDIEVKPIDDLLDNEHLQEIQNLNTLKVLLNSSWPNNSVKTDLISEDLKPLYNLCVTLHKEDWQTADLQALATISNDAFTNISALLAEKHTQELAIKKLIACKSRLDAQYITLKQTLANKLLKIEELGNNNSTIYDKGVAFFNIRSLNKEVEQIRKTLSNYYMPGSEMFTAVSQIDDNRKTLNEIEQKLENQRKNAVLKVETTAKELLTSTINTQANLLITNINNSLENELATVKKYLQQEHQKARYQTRRFASVAELLQYEAELNNEPELFKVKALNPSTSSLSKRFSFFNTNKLAENRTISMPPANAVMPK